MKVSVLKKQANGMLAEYKQKTPAAYAAAQQAIGGVLVADGLVGIENPMDGKKKRPGIFGSLLGVIVGIAIIFAPHLLGNVIGLNKMTATTTGTVVSIARSQSTNNGNNGTNGNTSSSCAVTAMYTVNQKQYVNQATISSGNDCSLSAGQSITINYDPNNPGAWASDVQALKSVFKYMPYVGIFIALSSLFTFIIRLLSIIFGWKLIRSGRALAATLPDGANLSTVIAEIKQNYLQSLFGGTPATPGIGNIASGGGLGGIVQAVSGQGTGAPTDTTTTPSNPAAPAAAPQVAPQPTQPEPVATPQPEVTPVPPKEPTALPSDKTDVASDNK